MAKRKKIKYSRKHYQFSKEQKVKVVQEIETGKLTRLEAMEKYNIIAHQTLKSWLIQYGSGKDVLNNKQYRKADHRLAAYKILVGESTAEEVAREMEVGITAVRKWVKEYKGEFKDTNAAPPNENKPPSLNDKASKKDVEELRLKVAGLELMIDIAEKELGIEIRKKSGTKQ